MGKIIIDTNILIEYFRGNDKVTNLLNEDVRIDNIIISYITKIELIKGCKDRQSLKSLLLILDELPTLHNSKAISMTTTKLLEDFHLSKNIQLADATIAAICLYNQYPLMTLNIKDFHFIPNLKLIKFSL